MNEGNHFQNEYFNFRIEGRGQVITVQENYNREGFESSLLHPEL